MGYFGDRVRSYRTSPSRSCVMKTRLAIQAKHEADLTGREAAYNVILQREPRRTRDGETGVRKTPFGGLRDSRSVSSSGSRISRLHHGHPWSRYREDDIVTKAPAIIEHAKWLCPVCSVSQFPRKRRCQRRHPQLPSKSKARLRRRRERGV